MAHKFISQFRGLAAAGIVAGAFATVSLATVSPAMAGVLVYDSFEGSDIAVGDGSSINGGFFGFPSNQTPNFSTAIESGGAVQLIGDSFTRDSGFGLISKTGFDANQQLTVTWNIRNAFLVNQPDADFKDLDKIVMGITGGQGFGALFTGLEISLENGGTELRVRLHDSHVSYVPDDYVSGLASGWNGQDAVTVTAALDPNGFSVAVSTMAGAVSGAWTDQTRAVSYLDQITDAGTGLSYVFVNHFGSDTVFGPPHHYTTIDAITVSDAAVDIPAPAALPIVLLGGLLVAGSAQGRRRRFNR
ncbi:MAG: hypothetical protein KDE14_11910 [Rhodobacteraceae bacterium]|nr:hypothetical protein [Paracoccaceae bacterium]